jgi:hypothetical protein
MERFGSLTTTGRTEMRGDTKRRRFVECRCDCGRTIWTMQQSLLTGCTRSCGCSRLKMRRRVTLRCDECRRTFERHRSQVQSRAGTNTYCSRICRDAAATVPPDQRFWAKVNKTDGCWLWTAATQNGYGVLTVPKGFERKAHRFSWTLHTGRPIPPGIEICHKCDTPLCVRPMHLFEGTHADNMQDMAAKGRNGSITHPEKTCRGMTRPAAKLTDDIVRAIRAAVASGATQASLAVRYNVTQTLISMVARRAIWRHVS